MSVILVLSACLIALMVVLSLLKTLLRALIGEFLLYVDELVNAAVALFFFLVIVPPLWLWEKGRRPMWRTLTKEQSRELEAWLRRGVGE